MFGKAGQDKFDSCVGPATPMTRETGLAVLGLEHLGGPEVSAAALKKAVDERVRQLQALVHPDKHPRSREASEHLFRLVTDARDALDPSRPEPPAPGVTVTSSQQAWSDLGTFAGSLLREVFTAVPTNQRRGRGR
jgi:hypothetical protein